MDNQHKKIKGYRDLCQAEVDLMNEIKEHGEKTKVLIDKVREMRLGECQSELHMSPYDIESLRCIGIAQDNLQTGQMWLVRSVAMPESF
jgi:hypothetical protein